MSDESVNAEIDLKIPADLPVEATFVGFVWVDRVVDDVQVYLCDIELADLRKKITKAREANVKPESMRIEARAFQRLFLSKVAVRTLHESLTRILESWGPDQTGLIEGAEQ